MGETINIVDVSARDGLQNEPRLISTAEKLSLIEKLVRAGVRDIQATSFVHPKWVPQMADAETLAANFSKFTGVRFSALVPNVKGYERAVASGVRYLEFVLSASDSFNRKNLNRTLPESLALLAEVSHAARRDGVTIRVGISTSFHCPFEGPISSQALLAVMKAARKVAPWRIAICDTDGMAYPNQVREAVALVSGEMNIPASELALHFHDTYGRGLANTLAGLDGGVREFDASVAGLGGCPYCPGASGNLATEDLVAFLHGMGYDTGIDLGKLCDAAELASHFTQRDYQGHLLRVHRAAVCLPGSASSAAEEVRSS
jgi:hydroxymethylglutaryl-CoA lyase